MISDGGYIYIPTVWWILAHRSVLGYDVYTFPLHRSISKNSIHIGQFCSSGFTSAAKLQHQCAAIVSRWCGMPESKAAGDERLCIAPSATHTSSLTYSSVTSIYTPRATRTGSKSDFKKSHFYEETCEDSPHVSTLETVIFKGIFMYSRPC